MTELTSTNQTLTNQTSISHRCRLYNVSSKNNSIGDEIPVCEVLSEENFRTKCKTSEHEPTTPMSNENTSSNSSQTICKKKKVINDSRSIRQKSTYEEIGNLKEHYNNLDSTRTPCVAMSHKAGTQILDIVFDLFYIVKYCKWDECYPMNSLLKKIRFSKLRFSSMSTEEGKEKFQEAKDGEYVIKRDKSMPCLEISSMPFKEETEGWFDHYKCVFISEMPFACPIDNELKVEFLASGMTRNTKNHPFPKNPGSVDDPENDPRLASSMVFLFDHKTGIMAQFIMTNRTIYIGYTRIPINTQKKSPIFQKQHHYFDTGFMHLIPVYTRNDNNPIGDYHYLKISYHRKRGLLRWYIDGEEIFRVRQIGRRLAEKNYLVMDHGGIDDTIEPLSFQIGFGTCSFLDAHNPNQPWQENMALVRLYNGPYYYFHPRNRDPITSDPILDSFIFNESNIQLRLWDQGASLRICRITASYQ